MQEIFGYFVKKPGQTQQDHQRSNAFALWFCDHFPPEEFQGVEFLLRHLVGYASKFNVPISEKYVKAFIASELKPLVLKNNVRVKGTEDISSTEDMLQMETLIARSKEVLLGEYYSLLHSETELEEFPAAADMFITERLSEATVQAMSTSFEIKETGVKGLVGPHDAAQYLIEEMAKISEMYNREILEELESEAPHGASLEFVTDTGFPSIDRDSAGGRKGQLFGVEAPPGTGKTRLTTGVWTYRAAVLHKRNCAYYALEQSQKEIEGLLTATHYYNLYGEEIDAKWIMYNEVPEEMKAKVEAARIDLFESGKYGKIKIFCKKLYLESFIETMKRDDALHGPFDMISIDYMALIEQKPQEGRGYYKQLNEYEIIKKAYRKFKRYVLFNDKFGIAINQLNRDGEEKSKKGLELDTTDAQGGMEVYRSTDYNMAMVCTPEMERRGLREIQNPKKRNSAGVGRIMLKTRLGCCLFKQEEMAV